MNSNSNTNTLGLARTKLILAMTIFGTIGIFVRYIPLPSSVIACVRGFVGVAFLLLVTFFKKSKISFKDIKKNLLLLTISGAFIGINWILLFEAYRYTTVATATLCYYMAPIFVTIASPFVLKEKLTLKKVLCVLTALIGMVFVSGIIGSGSLQINVPGIMCGLGAAFFYACVILLNKHLKDISSYDMTMTQLLIAAVVILPYTLLTTEFSVADLDIKALACLLIVGVIHTGFAYMIYFSSISSLKAQTVAIFSYIDPVIAIILSALFLKEEMDIFGLIGAILILGSTLLSEINFKKK
ncbi:MAG: EamA family transporter [Lachnospiraceae bacterium]|nr:EamA family transporter [Lachnospiraceae bacterium]